MFVFISHASADAHYADQLERAMRPGGYRAWRFQSDMVGARPWDPQLPANIEECAIFLLATTENALDSISCEREWQHAALKHKPFVPVVLKHGVYPPSPIDAHQLVYFDGSDESGAKLIVALQNAQPLPWDSIPGDWKTWDGRPKADLTIAKTERRKIPLPRFSRDLTDLEKEEFLHQALLNIRAYFVHAFAAFERADSRIQTRMHNEADTAFRCEIYVNGEIKQSCFIWKSDTIGFNGIGYNEEYGRISSFNRNAYDGLARVSDLEGSPALEFTLFGMFFQPDDCKICTVDKAAECLWRYFIRSFNEDSAYW